MNKMPAIGCLLLAYSVCGVCRAGEPGAPDRATRTRTLDEAESRFRAAYDRHAFRPAEFQAEWLADSSGYTTVEPSKAGTDRVTVRYDLPGGDRTVLGPRPSNSPGIVSPDGLSVIVSQRNDLYVRPTDGDETTRLTHSGPDSPVVNSQAAWSPDGSRIVFVETDHSRVRVRSTLVPGDPTFPEVRGNRFARVGEAIPKLRVGVVDAGGKVVRWLFVPEPAEGQYLGQVAWAGTDEVLVERMSRFRDEREFLLANAETGAVRRIFHESDPAWVVASYQTNAGLEWIHDGRAFVVLSETDGWRRAYVYSRDGEQQAVLTPEGVDVIARGPVDEAGGWYYYFASPDNATQKYLHRARLDGSGQAERVSPADQPGTHTYDFSPDAKWAFHTYSSFNRPPVTDLVSLPDHRSVRVLEGNKALREKAKSLIARPTDFLTLDAGDFAMDAWMIKPKDFDPTKKYPVFVYVYGEPHAQTVLDSWGAAQADFHRVIADLGYLVVSIENRGTPAPKGAAWRRAVAGCLGPITVADQAAGLKDLARQRPYVDLSRVGIWGWSGGGSNTLNAMFRRPDVFHVGIAVAPKPQPWLYNAWFQEIYMETRETNPDGYQRSAPLHFAEGLTGDLLILHGTGETNTHLQITEGLIDRLIELGKRFDYMAYPNRDHGLREGKGTVVHVRMLIAPICSNICRPARVRPGFAVGATIARTTFRDDHSFLDY